MYCLACVCALLSWFLELGFLFQYHSSQSGLSFFSLRNFLLVILTICVHLDHSCSKVPHGSLELTGFFELFLFFLILNRMQMLQLLKKQVAVQVVASFNHLLWMGYLWPLLMITAWMILR